MVCNVPDWMKSEESYVPVKDSNRFIKQSLSKITHILSEFKSNINSASKMDTPFKFLIVMLVIILIACSKNMAFTYIIFVALAIRICILNGIQIRNVVSASFTASIFSALILLPSVFLGSPRTLFTVTLKVFITVSMLRVLSITTKWNELTASFRLFKIPDVMILTFDLTLKYIQLLCEVCDNLFTSLLMRSIGKNKQKSTSFSGVLGVTFVKSKEMSENMYQAMSCRCFSGDYKRKIEYKHIRNDVFGVIGFLLIVVLFVYLEFYA